MKTYDANALRHLEEINAAYEGQIVPFFSRGHVHVARNQEQATELNALRNKLRFEFEIAALQTIENAEHLAAVLRRTMGNVTTASQIRVSNELDFFSLWGARGRLPDATATATTGHLPFQANENRFIAYLKITPVNTGNRVEFDKAGIEYYANLAKCFLTIDTGSDGTHICIERDELSESGISPSGNLGLFYKNAKDSLDAEVAMFPTPHIWYVHNNFHVVTDGTPEQLKSPDGFLRYRPRAVDVASVMNYRGADSQKLLTLPALLQKYEGMGNVGLGNGSHPAITKDMLSLVFDAARQELFDPNGQPKSGAAIETAKQLRLLPANYNIA